MKHYKKRTIALCLASVITVVGAFGAENYKNSLLSLEINSGSGGYISITAFTEKPYNLPIKTMRQDANTYVLVFPETDCDAKLPKLNNYENIESIGISTFPYTNDKDGYTKITVKTLGTPVLKAKTMLFIPDGQSSSKYEYTPSEVQPQPAQQKSYWSSHESGETTSKPAQTKEPIQKEEQSTPAEPSALIQDANQDANTADVQNNLPMSANAENNPSTPYTPQKYTNTGSTSEHTTALICIFALILIIGFILMISKDKMAGVVGSNDDFNLDSDNEKSKKSKKSSKAKKIKNTINTLDKTYKTAKTKEYKGSKDFESKKPEQEEAPIVNLEEITPQMNVVDLDTLYHEKTQQKEPEQDDLAEFLKEFTFESEPESPQEELFNEELYQEIINNTKLSFSDSEIEMINQLMYLEITNETLKKFRKYKKIAASKPKPLTKEQVLENLLATYSISQNIEFTTEDVDIIRKLMDVEIDRSFITDLTTNPNRTKEMERELKSPKLKSHKPSEILTLNVKNLLPDLSKELEKQGNKPIESEVKANVVYFSEGYEVSKLSVSDDLSDISTALKNNVSNEYRPSDFIPVVEQGYEFSTLSIKDELPDLEDVKAHPDKYEDKKNTNVTVDENALLKSISNVTFKPFYTEEQETFNQFESFEHPNIENEPTEKTVEPKVEVKADKINSDAEKLLRLIETQQAQRALKKQAQEVAEFKKELQKTSENIKEKTKDIPQAAFELDNKKYTFLKTVSCTDNAECSLVQSDDGYYVFGYVNGKRIYLKHYENLTTTNMQIRKNDKQGDKSNQYIIKIGFHKFIIKYENNEMEFVMDLC